MKTVNVKIHNSKETIQEIKTVTKDGQPDVIKAVKNVNYEFFDESIGRAPNHIITRRVGNDLHVSFEREGKETDLIIEGFYQSTERQNEVNQIDEDADNNQALIGIAEDGSYYHYIPDTGQVYDYVTQLEVGAVEGQALGGEEIHAPWWIAVPAGFPWWLGLGLIPFLIDDNDDNDDNDYTPPVEDNKPIAEDDTKEGNVGEPVVIDVVGNDTDPDGDLDPTTVQLIDPKTGKPTDEPVEVPGEGVWSVNPETGEVTFTPEQGFSKDPTPIDYTVKDKAGNTSEPATITVDYPQNPPVAEDDTKEGNVGNPVVIDVLANDKDPDGDLDPTTVQLIDPKTGKPTDEPVEVPGEGVWSVNPETGEVTFTPEKGFSKDPTPIDYTVKDKAGNTSEPATITVDYPQNPPVAEDDTKEGNVGEPVIIDVVGNDTDPDGDLDPTTVQLIDPKTGQPTDEPVEVPGEGVWSVNPETGEATFTPEQGFSKDPTPIDYTVKDKAGNTSEPATITVDYPPTVNINATDDQAIEGVDNLLVFEVSQNQVSTKDTTVKVSLGKNSTIEAEDIASISYTKADGTQVTLDDQAAIEAFLTNGDSIKIPAGETAAPAITVTVVDDDIYEVSEDMVLEISNPSNAALGTPTATGVIKDEADEDGNPTEGDRPEVNIKATVAEAVEGEGTALEFEVSQTNPSNEDTTVDVNLGSDSSIEPEDIEKIEYTDVDGNPVVLETPEEIADFLENGATVLIPAGETKAPAIKLTPKDDDIYEVSEDVVLEISSPQGAKLGESIKDTAVIKDEADEDGNPTEGDKPTLNLVATDKTAVEGAIDDPIVFEVQLDGDTELTTTAKVTLNLGQIEPEDIQSISFTDGDGTVKSITVAEAQAGIDVTIPATGGVTPTFTIVPLDDAIYEKSEAFSMTLSDVEGAKQGALEATATILDEDQADNDDNPENPDDPTDPTDGDKPVVKIEATVAEAVEGEDTALEYVVSQNNLSELDSTVDVNFADSNEIDATDIIKVEYTDADGNPVVLETSEEIADFFANGVTIKIPAGSKEAPAIKLTPANDNVYEKSEDAILEISNPSNAALGTPTATGVIKDEADEDGNPTEGDRPEVNIKATVAEAVEGEGTALEFEVSQTNPSNEDTTVDVNLGSDSSIEPEDIEKIEYTDVDGNPVVLETPEEIADFLENGATVLIPAGETKAPAIKLTPKDDDIYEVSEDVVLEISSPQGAKLGESIKDTAVIKDEADEDGNPTEGDKPTLNLVATDKTAVEGAIDDPIVFEVQLDGDTELTTTAKVTLNLGQIEPEDIQSISFTDGDGTVKSITVAEAQAGIDVTIPATGGVTPTFTIVPLDDAIYEKSEAFSMTLSDVEGAKQGALEATATILDEDQADNDDNPENPDDPTDPTDGDKPVVKIEATVAEAVEGEDTALEYVVSQNNLSELDSTVDVNFADSNEIDATDIIKVEYTDVDGNPVVLETSEEIADFFANGVTIKIPAGSKEAPAIKLTPANDNVYEKSEDAILEISNPSNAALGTPTATGVIKDEADEDGNPTEGDKPEVNIKATVAEAVEGEGTALEFEVSQTNPSNEDTTVDVNLGSDSSIEPEDIEKIEYTDVDGNPVVLETPEEIADFLENGATVLIPAGETKAPAIKLTPKDDDIYEVSEDVVLEISSPQGAKLGESIKDTAVIKDEADEDGNPTEGDKPEVSIAATAPKAIEGIDNTLVFEITQDNVSEFDTTVDVKLGADSTIEAEDIASISYTKADGTQVTLGDQAAIEAFLTNGDSIKIPAGETAAPAIIVTVVDDDIYEVSEDMVLEIGNPENATIGTPSATGVILDENNGDDDKPTITVEDAEIVEGSSLVHTVTLDKATDAPVSYDLVLEDGTAVVGEDYDNTLTFSNGVTYDATTGQITIPAGVTEFTVTYPTISDNEIEYDETTKLTIGDSTATGTILDDDVPALVINDIAITETDEDQVVQFTVSIEDTTRLPLEAITVDVEIEHVSTVSGDVSTTVTQVTIPAGSTSATVDVTVVGDDFWEPTETYNVKLSNPKNATISDDTGVGTIINDDITAVNDVGTAVEGGGNDNTDGSKDATGNVLDNDDPTNVNATVTGIRTGANEGSGTVGKVGTSLHGTYGTLTLNSDGSYTYEVDDENTTVQRLQEGEKLLESFNYTMSDGTLEDIAVLDITIQGNNDAPQILEITSTRVSEEGLTAETSADNGIKDNFSFNETDQIFRDAVDNEISDEKEALETAKSNLAENPNNSDLLAAVTAAEEALEQARTVAEQKHIELKNDQTDSASDTRGMITFTDVDNFKASDFTIVPTGAEVTVQGNAVSWEWIDTADTPRTLKGTAEVNGNVVDVMTIEVGESVKNANGNYEAPYSVTLMHAIDHPSNNDEDVLELQFNTVVSDGIDGSIAKPISVFVEDDRPTVAEGKDTILLEPVTSNVQLIVDTSGSMGWSSGVRDSFFLFDQNGDLITLTSDEGAAIYNEGIDIYATNGSQLYTYGANNDLVHFQDGYNVSTGGQGKPPAGHIKATDPNYGYYYIDSANGAVSLQVGSNTQYDVSEGVWKVYYQGKELGRVVNQSEVKVAKYVTDFDDNKVGDTISIERGLSRMEVTQNAILDMIKAYEDIGSTKIQIIDFDIEGRTFKDSKWLTVQETMDILFDLEAGNATNYDSALATAIKNFDKPGAIDKADYNRTYFLTDGFPNRGQKGDSLFGSNNVEEAGGISPTEELEWKTWLSPDGEPNNPRQTSSVAPDGITAFAYAMGDPSNVNVDLIHPIAYDGVTGHDMDGQQADFSNLAQQLLNSIPAPTSEDRDLINGSSSDFIGGLGADGGGFVSITISGITYEYDQEANTVTAEDGSTVNYDPAKHLLTATSSLTGGIFYVHMDDGTAPDGTAYSKGQYSYQTGSTVYGYKEPIYFNVKDADGDIVSSEQLIDVYRLKANNDSIITTQTGEVTIDYKTLMANDITRLSTEFNGATESVVGAIGTITDPNTVTVTLDNFKARFNYSISDGGFDSNAVVTITQVSGEQGIDAQGETFVIVRGDRTDNTIIGSDTTGTNIDYEVFYGRGDDDIIQGGGGVDKFFGGTGNDTFLVDLEDVEIDGGAGKDTIVFDSSVGAADVSEFISTTEISDIEVLDLFDGVNQTLTISDVTVERITDSNNTLFINAEKDDTIILEGFTESVNSNQAGYNMFESANATIYLDIDNVPTII